MEVEAGLRGDPDQDDDQKKMEDPQPLSTDICIGQKLVVTVEDANPDLSLSPMNMALESFREFCSIQRKGKEKLGQILSGCLVCLMHKPSHGSEIGMSVASNFSVMVDF